MNRLVEASNAVYERARLSRDARFDGRFFDAVDGRRLRPRELEVRASSWRPWRAYAALLIWGSDGGAGG